MINIFYNNKNLNDTLIVSVSNDLFDRKEISEKHTIFYKDNEFISANIFNFSNYLSINKSGFLYPTNEIIKAIESAININLTKYIDKNFVVGKIINLIPVPNTHLNYCDVQTDNNNIIKVICGAKNAALNALVVVAMIGTCMPNGLPIVKGKIQGYESFGMLCSEKELNLAESSNGIIILNENQYNVGDLFDKVFSNK